MLGFEVYEESEAEAIVRYRKMLLGEREALKGKGIFEKDGIWYFEESVGYWDYISVGGKQLGSFPSATFNKRCKNGDASGLLKNADHLRKLFSALGLRVATPDEECARFRELLVAHKDELAEIGMVYRGENRWKVGKIKEHAIWPFIGRRKLTSFPKCRFNRVNAVGAKDGKLTCGSHLVRMLLAIGAEVVEGDDGMK